VEAPILETPRLTLRPVEIDDAAAIAQVMTPEVTRWLASWPNPTTPAFARERVAQSRAATARGGHVWWGLIHRADQRLIGGFSGGLTPTDARRMEIAYHIAQAYQGLGYMREAAQVAMDAIWSLFDIDAIEAGAQVANAASFGLMQAMGMTPIGDRHIYGSARDRVEPCRFYELLRPAASR
jgi:RimJ/RimL family protein N-acetyltransferase